MNSALKFIFQSEITEEEYEEAYKFVKRVAIIGTVISLITIIL